jgi:HlyD family secretion protein
MPPRTPAMPVIFLLIFAVGVLADEPPRPSPRAEAVYSEAEGDRAILYIVPEGSRVTKGQVVCVLDAIRGPRTGKDQWTAVQKAAASYDQAGLAREVAEIAVMEYEQGIFRQSLETIQGDIAMAQAELKRAEDRHEQSQKRIRKNPLNADGVAGANADKFSLDKARFTLEQALVSKDVLLKYTKEKTIKELRSEVEKARSDELARKRALDAELARVKSLEGPTRPSVVLAPVEGTVVLAKPARLVAVGAEVCKDQLLLRVVPSGR